MRTRLRLVEKCVSAQNSIDRLLERSSTTRPSPTWEAIYQFQAACHQAQIDLLEEQITTLERELHPHLILNPDVQRLLWMILTTPS